MCDRKSSTLKIEIWNDIKKKKINIASMNLRKLTSKRLSVLFEAGRVALLLAKNLRQVSGQSPLSRSSVMSSKLNEIFGDVKKHLAMLKGI